MNRRKFLKRILVLPFAGAVAKTTAQEAKKSLVAVVRDTRSVSRDFKLDGQIVQKMAEQAILLVSGCESIEDAWRKLIPNLKESDVIGIKVNCICSSLPTHPEVAFAIARTLVQAGVKENNIVIWDRMSGWLIEGLKKCHYKVNTGASGIRCFGTDTSGVGYDRKNMVKMPSVGKEFPVSKIISRVCNYIISVPVLKNHGIAGITGSMKNFYGAIPLGDRLSLANVRAAHKDNASPQIAELCANPIIRDKLRLCILDALMGIYTGGPIGNPQWRNYEIIASTDPVALDAHQLGIIDARRKLKGRGPAARKAKHIAAAAQLNLGTNDPSRILVREKVLG